MATNTQSEGRQPKIININYAEQFETALAEHREADDKLKKAIRAAHQDADCVEAYEQASEEELHKAAKLGRIVSAEAKLRRSGGSK